MFEKTIGVDARTLEYSASVSRGIGHYTLYHIKHLLKLRPLWKFVLFGESAEPNKIISELLQYDNTEYREISSKRLDDISLIYISDPMSFAGGYDSPLRIFASVENKSVLFHDLTPILFYFEKWPDETKNVYLNRLRQYENSDAVFLANSVCTKSDLRRLTKIPANKIHPILAGLNSSGNELTYPPEEIRATLAKHSITKKFFLHVGSLEAHKNFSTLLKAFYILRSRYECELIVVGKKDGNTLEYERMIELNEKIKDVKFVGYLERKELEMLYKSAAATVFLSYYEGFGFPLLEAMSQGCPVISSNRGSLPEVGGDAAIYADPDDYEKIYKSMLRLLEDENLADKLKKKGIAQAKKFTWDDTAQKTIKVWEEEFFKTEFVFSNENPLKKEPVDKYNIVWEGPIFSSGSLALVNRELSLNIFEKGHSLKTKPMENDNTMISGDNMFRELSKCKNAELKEVDFSIRHHWPPSLVPPQKGKWIVIQPWEFGSLPKQWAHKFENDVDEMWVPSSYVKDVYVSSGVSEDRVFVIPNGINPQKFNPEIKPYKLHSKKKFKFLFVGGTIYRKGIDILLDVYLKTFKSGDDVCLVIKDMGGDSFYNGRNMKEEILKLSSNKELAEIEYIDFLLDEKELAGLYAACNVLVHPYRGEGFGLPILEAMACGIPAIVTNGGAALDFCSEKTNLLVDANKIVLEEKRIGEFETVDFPWLFDPSKEDLKKKMIFAVENLERIKTLGKDAAVYVKENWTWRHSYSKLENRLKELHKKPIRRSFAHAEIMESEELIEAGKLEEAKNVLSKILNRDENNIDALNNLAVVEISLNRIQTAADIITKVIGLDPQNEVALNNALYLKEKLEAIIN